MVVPILLVVLPATIVMGFTFPAASTLLGDDPARIAANAGRLLAANTAGAILATFAIPFFVIPAVGSPNAVALLALVNVATAALLVLSRSGRAAVSQATRLATGAAALVVAVAIVGGLVTPGTIVDPSVARIRNAGATLFASREDEIASVQAGATVTPQLWVTGTAMTLLTVDAKLMPVLPLALRPQSHDRDRPSRSAWARRSAARSSPGSEPRRWSSSRPSPRCSRTSTPMPPRSSPTRTAR